MNIRETRLREYTIHATRRAFARNITCISLVSKSLARFGFISSRPCTIGHAHRLNARRRNRENVSYARRCTRERNLYIDCELARAQRTILIRIRRCLAANDSPIFPHTTKEPTRERSEMVSPPRFILGLL